MAHLILCIVLPTLIFLLKHHIFAKYRFIEPLPLVYGFGIVMANTDLVEINRKWTEYFAAGAVVCAMPAMLFSLDVKGWLKHAKKTLLGVCFFFTSVTISAASINWMFEDNLEESPAIAGMLVGTFTGSAPNLAAIGIALKVPATTFLLVQTADLVVCMMLFLFLNTMSIFRIYQRLPLIHVAQSSSKEYDSQASQEMPSSFQNLLLIALLIVICLGGGLFAALVFSTHEQLAAILAITATAIGLSFNRQVRAVPGTFKTGEILFLFFCIAAGSLVDFSKFLQSSLAVFLFAFIVLWMSIFLHFFLCKCFKIDSGTFLMTMVGGIFSPAMLGPIVSLTKERQALICGIITAILGLATGNFLGIALAHLLKS